MTKQELDEKYRKLGIEAERTVSESLEKMANYGKVMVVRPTGFGKTRMLVNIAKTYAKNKRKKKIAYIYPLNIIVTEIKGKSDYMKDGIIDKYVDFISYQTLTKRIHEKGIDFWYNYFKDNYSLIMLDEVHSAGSEGFNEVYVSIKELIKPDGIHMIGVTATPNRMSDTEDFSVFNNIFDSIGVYEFSLADCFRLGLIPEIVLATRKYNLEQLAEDLKAKKKIECKNNGTEFDEKVFNVELGKVLRNSGTEAEYIYKYIAKAGYNLASASDKYFKFIVFFIDIEDMCERGPEVEEWFTQAFNDVAKKNLGLKKEFDVNTYYVASSDTENKGLAGLIKSDPKHRSYFNRTEKLNNIERQDYTIDLLFTVNMINMGYHVDNITGIMMLRGTKSEVVYYQQLGRCLSVTSEHHPIVYDMVRNIDMKFWSKKDRQYEIQNKLLQAYSERGENADLSGIDIFIEGDEDEFEEFMNRWSDTYYSEKAHIIYMYNERKAPICVIASDINKNCTYIAKILLESKIELRQEDAMYRYYDTALHSSASTKENKNKSLKIMKYIYSKKAMEVYKQARNTVSSLYMQIKKLLGGN